MKAKVAQYKKDTVKQIVKEMKDYPIVGVVNMESLPAQQLNAMRADLRDKMKIVMTKKRLIKIGFESMKGEKKGIEGLEQHLRGMPALILTKDNPFLLSKMLKKSKTAAPAKAGQTAPNDVVIKAGPTPFPPGPIISELGSVGLQVGVEGGKVAVKEDSVIVKEGEQISQKIADVLTRLDIKPMEVGLDLVAVYEDGLIYDKKILNVDEQEYLDNLAKAGSESFNLAFNIGYTTKQNIELFITKAFTDAKGLGMEANVIDEGIVPELLSKAERSMLSLKAEANVPDTPAEAPKEEAKAEEKHEEKPAEEKKEEPPKEEKKAEPEPQKEEKKEEPKPEEKKPEEKPAEPVKEEPKAEEKKEEAPAPEPKPAPEAPKEQPKEEKPAEEEKKPEPAQQESKPEPKEAPKPEEKKEETPKAEEKKEEKAKEDAEQKEVEDLAAELVKKGTLRK